MRPNQLTPDQPTAGLANMSLARLKQVIKTTYAQAITIWHTQEFRTNKTRLVCASDRTKCWNYGKDI